MFCFQRRFNSPTELITPELFWALAKAPETARKVSEGRAALKKGDKATYDKKKKSLPLMIFIATYDESEKEIENKETGEKTMVKGMWRNQQHVNLNGLVVVDYDHLEGDVREVWAKAYAKLSDEDKARIVLVYVTPSGHGLKVVLLADPNIGNLIANQKDYSAKLGLACDEQCRDGSRGAFLTTDKDIIYIDEEKLFNYENKAFGERYDALYRDGRSQDTNEVVLGTDYTDLHGLSSVADQGGETSLTYNGVPVLKIVEAWIGDKDLTNKRHDTLVELSSHLRYIVGRNPKKITEVVSQLPWVQELAKEGEDVGGTVKSVMDFKYKEYMPKKLKDALAKTGADNPDRGQGPVRAVDSSSHDRDQSPCQDGSQQEDVYAMLPLDKWAEELEEMAQHYPCMKQLFMNVHPHKKPAVLFAGAALYGTLMTRSYYHFWYEPEIVRRLNYCIFIIGDPGAGKNVIEKFYKKIADPMIQADQIGIDAVNRYKESRTERTTSSKAQKGEALKKPEVIIRVHPARTATGEFIRHMRSAVEVVQGVPMNLHMFSFDAELDNVTKNNKGGDWKDREILELKAFHNEEDGQMYANQESVSGMFNVYWNFIYTGTPYALHRKVNQRNYGTGMSSRLAVIPLPDVGLAKRNQEVDPEANETLKEWAYRLDKVSGELPIEPLNDETYEWQSSRMEIAQFNGDKADRQLLKRIPYYGIGISLPFIVMRHWDEWQEHRTLTMDDMDRRLCRLAMEIQYRSQQFFFGEMAFNYFADQNKEFVVRRRSTKYDECYAKLPDEFKTKDFMECFGCGSSAAAKAINRLKTDGVIENVKYGLYKKVLKELP
jgi:hypothetical protein